MGVRLDSLEFRQRRQYHGDAIDIAYFQESKEKTAAVASVTS